MAGVRGSQVVVPKKVSAVLGKNVTLGCRVEVGANLSLTQTTWERRLPAGSVTLAVYNPVFGISIPPEYARRLSFRSPSHHDATVVLEEVGFADAGVYTCKVATFPLGITQASTTVSVLVEPKVYVSAGSAALVDGANETTVATCVAERARPPAQVSWESELPGQALVQLLDQANGTTSTHARYVWQPTRHAQGPAQGHALTCVVRHPALHADVRIPYQLSVLFAPDISLLGYDGDWYVGRENAQLTCKANANPPAHHFRWTRLDGDLAQGVEGQNATLLFLRPLQKSDAGVYRCQAANDISLQRRDVRILVQDPPTTSMPSTTPAPVLNATASPSTSVGEKRRVLFTSPTLAALPSSHLGSIVGGAVGGALFLLLLLSLGGVWYLRQQQTFRGDYYTKTDPGPPDMQKTPEQHELHSTKLANSYGSNLQDPDREEWGGRDPHHDRERSHPNSHNNHTEYAPKCHTRAMREASHLHSHPQYPNPHQTGHPQYPNPHQTGHATYLPPARPLTNGSPYLSEDCYDSGPEGDYVSHTDGSVISRREWYL